MRVKIFKSEKMLAVMNKYGVYVLWTVCLMTAMGVHSNYSYAQDNGFGKDARTIKGDQNIFCGPRQNIPSGTPNDQGFWSFSIPVSKVLSRSGQPSIKDFKWLKDNGWKSVVDLRMSNDAKIKGFSDLHFTYLDLPIVDGTVPSDQQALEFLKFVTDPVNQPVHVHCRAGIGRTGVMTALYRYMLEAWPMDEAIRESRLFRGGVNELQESWLKKWARDHKPGSFLSRNQAPN